MVDKLHFPLPQDTISSSTAAREGHWEWWSSSHPIGTSVGQLGPEAAEAQGSYYDSEQLRDCLETYQYFADIPPWGSWKCLGSLGATKQVGTQNLWELKANTKGLYSCESRWWKAQDTDFPQAAAPHLPPALLYQL